MGQITLVLDVDDLHRCLYYFWAVLGPPDKPRELARVDHLAHTQMLKNPAATNLELLKLQLSI